MPNNLRVLENQQRERKVGCEPDSIETAAWGGNNNNNINDNNNLLHLLELCS